MNNYYFTFGQSHATVEGLPMKDKWVRVVAESFMKADQLFREHFAKPFMGSPVNWSMQYSELEFKFDHFPEGEYAFIEQHETPPFIGMEGEVRL